MGLIDLQVNGFAGVDFQQPMIAMADLDRALDGLLAHDTERILVTLITDDVESLCRKLKQFERLRSENPRATAMIAGYHLEGPYLSPEDGYRGAHDPTHMKAPALVEFDRFWAASGGRLKLITLAPEWPGSGEFIRHATAHGVRIAIGHSNADAGSIDAAVTAGLTLCTHLGNGVPNQLHRHENIVQRLLARDELFAAFIPDGIHLPPPVLRNFVRAKPASRVLFTTDCMSAAGAPPGRYALGRLRVEVGKDRIVRDAAANSFAGSSLTMDEAVRNVSAFVGWNEAEARAACGSRVAEYLGLSPRP